MTHAVGNQIIGDNDEPLATFQTHRQAVAAMLRLSNPGFRSLGGDAPEATHVENEMRRRMKLTPIEWRER